MTTLDTRPRAPGFRPLSLDSSTGCRPVVNMAKTPFPPSQESPARAAGHSHADRRRRRRPLQATSGGWKTCGNRICRAAEPPGQALDLASLASWHRCNPRCLSQHKPRGLPQPGCAAQRTEMTWSPGLATSTSAAWHKAVIVAAYARCWPPNRGASRGQQPAATRMSPDFSSLTRNVPSGRRARPWAALTPVTRVLTVPDDKVTALIVPPPLSAT